MRMALGPAAHGLIRSDLTVVDIDSAYESILSLPRGAIIGHSVLDTLAAADRPAGERQLRHILDSGEARFFTHRHARADGSILWVNLHVSRIGAQGDWQLAVTCQPLREPDVSPSAVEAQWRMARMLLTAIGHGKRAFGQALMGNPATEIMLSAYVAEAEARAINGGEIARRITVDWLLARRWLLALGNAGFIELERPGPITDDTPIRLSPQALAMLETIFGSLLSVAQGMPVEA
ncbi:PAS domain-containing protein [Sphingomonas sp. CV7422]|uniref:PAS domain-containing protein n=2 Tax=Sphingomonadaceae TaxID=41297 RepID=A0ABU8H7H5_9SPHN|nr:PAS domain-containing protein [Sphingomonas sp. CV7422]